MRALLSLLLSLAAAPACVAAPLHWYVVFGSFDAETEGPLAADALRREASLCDPTVWTEYTSKMRGLRPGFVATLTGPFDSRTEAERGLERAKPCAPDAYVKRAEEGGE